MPVTNASVLSTHLLEGPRGRRYMFRVLVGSVAVERWEGGRLSYRRAQTTEHARRLYKYLTTSCGYQRW